MIFTKLVSEFFLKRLLHFWILIIEMNSLKVIFIF